MTVDVEALAAAPARPSRAHSLFVRTAVGLGIGVAFVLVFIQLINVRSVSRRIEDLNVGIALLSGAVFLSAYVVRALRWRLFLAPDRVGAGRVIGIYFIATFLNWLLPVQAGEVAKCGALRRTNGIPVNRSLATVAMDKAMDLLPAAVLLTLVPFAHVSLSRGLWLFLLLPLFALGVGVLLIAFASWQRDRTTAFLSALVWAILPRRMADRVEPFIVGFVDTLVELIRRPRLLATAAVYTAAAVALDALFCYLAFRAVGTTLSFPVALYGYTLYNLAYILPTLPAHLGSNELIGLLIFSGVFGASRSAVGAMFVFSHPFTGALMTVTALVCVKAIGLNFRATLGLASVADSTVKS